MKIAYAICSLGLGHASRSVPLIEKLINEGHDVYIIAHGRPIHFIKKYFNDIKIIDIPDFPIEYTKSGAALFPYIIFKSPRIIESLLKEHSTFVKLFQKENFKAVISDNRYGIFAPVNSRAKSFLITHQLRIMNPYRIKFLEDLSMFYNSFLQKYFNKILVPDFEENSLSGDLSHNLKYIDMKKVEYIGPISQYRKIDAEKNIDTLFVISGPEPQRTIFENIVLNSLKNFDGKYFVLLGRPDKEIEDKNIKSFVGKDEMEILLNSSKIIVSRSGYSTIMDLYFTGGKAVFVPTPSQPEQEYLAKYMEEMNLALQINQDDFSISKIFLNNNNILGFKGGYTLDKTLERFMESIQDV